MLVPTNAAMLEYRGPRGEELALNHLVNAVVLEVRILPTRIIRTDRTDTRANWYLFLMQNNMPNRLSSLVTGSPPVWVTRRSAWLYFNQVPNHDKSEGRMQL